MMKKIIVYGIGKNYTVFEAWIAQHYSIMNLADGNAKKQGLIRNGHIVKDLKSCMEDEFDFVLVTIAFDQKLVEYLHEQGLLDSQILFLAEEYKLHYQNLSRRICFNFSGGLGDKLIDLNYVKSFWDSLCDESMSIDIVCEDDSSSLKQLCDSLDFVADVYQYEDYFELFNRYEILVNIRRYPEVVKADLQHFSDKEKLIDYILKCEKFKIMHGDFFAISELVDKNALEYEKKRNGKRYSQIDVFSELNIREEGCIEYQINPLIISDLGLDGKKIITIHRGCDKNFFASGTKLWNDDNYEVLIKSLKSCYPQYLLVLVGEDYEYNEKLCDVDLNLLGKTDLPGLISLLKYSSLHIDTEGGLVHLRHFVGGGTSIVLFGPTSEKFYGYSENINIRTDACSVPCEWEKADWAIKCCRCHDSNICMQSITPQMVMDKIHSLLL